MLIDVAGSRPSYVLGTAERDMQDFLAAHLRAGDVVFDLGANVGFFTLVAAALVGPSGRVVAYEPLPTNAVALRRNVGLNELANVEVVEAAVSAAVGTAELDPNGSDQEGSLVVHRGSATISVPTVSVDAEADRLAVAPTLVKIDVEGAEGDVLTGMMRTLGTARPIVVCEVHQHHHDLSDPIPAALRAAGYDVTWLEPEAQSPDGFWAPHLVGVPRR
jgi:FkbM family methyltransferase